MSPTAIAMKNLYLAGKINYYQLQKAYEKNMITKDELDKIISLKEI